MCAMPCPPLRRECPKLTQEEFDEAVRTNMEDFDMEAEEAVKAAVEEFTLQNYDLGNVVKTAAGKELASHPVALATVAINEAKSVEEMAAAIAQLRTLWKAAESEGVEKLQEASAVALRSGSLAAVLRSIESAAGLTADTTVPEAGATAAVDATPLLAPLALAQRLMAASVDIRDSFDDLGGPELVMRLHRQHTEHAELQVELARMAECACYREEQNKEQLMLVGYGLALAEMLQRDPSQLTEDLVASASGVLRAVCTADDDRPPTSKAFQHARLLAHENQALKALLSLLKRIVAGWSASSSGGGSEGAPKSRSSPSTPETSAPVVAAVLACVRQLAASEEICKAFTDEGGVLTVLALVSQLRGKQQREVLRAGLGALRQLANSDGAKVLLAAHDAPTALLKCAASHPQEEDITEPVLGVLAAMTLRQPSIATQCAEAGVVDWVVEILADMAASPLVCRQACILMRNMVVRNPELRPGFLEKGAEALVRAAKAAHPANCKDVGYAALRDLGLDNYAS